tara:strand:+ start:2522 stop:2941 length:420 start_codon:yes stop_codon:yes gene_type:complete
MRKSDKNCVATSASEMEIEVPTNNETVSPFDDMTIFGQLEPGTPVGVTTMSFLKNLVKSASTASVDSIINGFVKNLNKYNRYNDSTSNMSDEDKLAKVVEIAREFAEFHDTIADIREATSKETKVQAAKDIIESQKVRS